MDEDELKGVLAGLPLSPVRYFDRIGSTNDEAAGWVESGAPHMALVVADEQTAGRGRLGRRWFTPPGAALAFSLVLRAEAIPCFPFVLEGMAQNDKMNAAGLKPEITGRLTALGGLAVCDALREGYHLAAQIKWPNDVLLEGCKAAGVLAEAGWDGESLASVILGIGINIAPESVPPDSALQYPAICIEEVAGRPVDRWQVLRATLEALLEWLPRISSADFMKAWEDRLALRGEWVRVTSAAGAALEGQVLGLELDGRLRLRLGSGQVVTLQTGEVHLRPVDTG